jgi:hypothetical protein
MQGKGFMALKEQSVIDCEWGYHEMIDRKQHARNKNGVAGRITATPVIGLLMVIMCRSGRYKKFLFLLGRLANCPCQARAADPFL